MTDPGAGGAGAVEDGNTQQARSRLASERFGARALLAFVALFLAAVPFAVLTALVASSWTPLLQLDRSVETDLHQVAVAHPAFTSTMRAISTIGSTPAWLVILSPVLVWLAIRRRYRLAGFVAVTAVGSWLLNNLIKIAVDRARPVLAHPVATALGKSFPSGHSQSAIVGYGLLVVVLAPVVAGQLRPWLAAFAVTMTVLIGFSRIALGVHFLSDVVGAWFIGGAWLLAMVAAFVVWRRETPPARREPPLDAG